jgi:glucose-1-phosphate cytidylyltransferase
MTGGRLARVKDYLDDSTFCFTYGDGLADVNIKDLISHHHSHGLKATLTAVQPPGRFGALHLEGNQVLSFQEKPDGDNAWINGGFFVLEPSVLNMIDSDQCVWEQAPLASLAAEGELSAFRHHGFWQPMDTLRDRVKLEDLWQAGKAPWKLWI